MKANCPFNSVRKGINLKNKTEKHMYQLLHQLSSRGFACFMFWIAVDISV